jgi:electron transport complex protein RnfE
MKNNKLAIFLRGIIAENPVLILVLGTCPALATSTSMFQAISMGLAATAVLVCSNIAISLLRKIIPDTVRIPCYIVVIASFVTAVQMLLQAYLPPVYDVLGAWLSLIVVNCIVLGRAEMFARKNGPLDSALDGLGMGIGFLVALLAMATIREVLGAGTILSGLEDFGIEAIKIPFIYEYRIPILTEAPGGFLVYGILIAVMNKITAKKGGIKRKDFSCEGCPNARACNKTSCSTAEVNTENKEVSENA